MVDISLNDASKVQEKRYVCAIMLMMYYNMKGFLAVMWRDIMQLFGERSVLWKGITSKLKGYLAVT